jgi:hypothetical protein
MKCGDVTVGKIEPRDGEKWRIDTGIYCTRRTFPSETAARRAVERRLGMKRTQKAG